jgi:putative endonuclease
MIQHKSGTFDGFSRKYKTDRLMYFETYTESKVAANREQQIKKYRRDKKISLVAKSNPGWKDLTPELFQSIGISRYPRDFRKKIAARDDHEFRNDHEVPKKS